MSRRADTPRDLLFGLLALQTGMIDQSALVIGFLAWTQSKGRPMAEILVEHGVIDLQQRLALESLAELHLQKHGGDAEKSLAAIGVGASTRQKLAAIANPDLDQSLGSVGAAVPLEDDPHATASWSLGNSTSGGQRFRVLRHHARGGLGEVFIALDAELNREVALKEILEHHADKPEYQSKFRLEAEITGGLEHPGIVPGYGLGHYDDGRPYYAMRFIKGDNLKQAIEDFHADETLKADPGAHSIALRNLLRRFTDVCNAIEYAHSRGVLHRDIKPRNVIVGRYGETLVVDWGLAKSQSRHRVARESDERTLIPSSASSSAETQPGSVIGTPAYMSPEQAAGDLDRLGPRSDVYSLGATLYSLLTGKPPFKGNVGEVLQDVREGRFPRPRLIDSTIDPALEALCLKAMAKSPEDRYPSPKAFAEDLDRWAADEPVSAWKEPLSRRARRWARRHRTGVTAASVATLALLVGLAGVLAVKAKADRDLLAFQFKANSDLKSKNELLANANARELKINADLKLANVQVQDRFNLAQEAIRSFSQAVTQDEMLKEKHLSPLRDKLLRSAAEFYGKLGQLLEGRPDRPSQVALGDAYYELGVLTMNIGDQVAALEIARKALAMRQGLAKDSNPTAHLALARSLYLVGVVAADTGDPAEALILYEQARAMIERDFPPASDSEEIKSLLATIHNSIGLLLKRTGEPGKALESYGRSLEIQRRLAEANPTVTESQSDLAAIHNNIGALLDHTGEPGKALESYGRALEIQRRLAEANPAVTKFQSHLAVSHNNIGTLLDRTGEPGKALESHGRSLEIRRRLAAANPAVTKFQSDLAVSHSKIGFLLDRTGEPGKALESHSRALEIQRRLAEAHPAVIAFQSDLAVSHNNIGVLLGSTGEPGKALESFGRALEIQRRLAEANPAVTEFQSGLAASHDNIGTLLDRNGELGKALESHGRSLEIRRRLAGANPAVTAFQADLAASHNNLGFLLDRIGEPGKALESHGRAFEIRRRLAEANPVVTEFQADLAKSHNNLGFLLDRIGESGKALESFGRALEIQRRLAEANPAVTAFQYGLAVSHSNIGTLLYRTGEPGKALESHGRALEIRRRLAEANPGDTKFQADLAASHNNIGSLLDWTGEPGKALESHGRALEIRRRLAEANPIVPAFQSDLAASHNNIGALLYRTGEPGKALESYGRSLEIRRRLAEAHPAITAFQFDLAISHSGIAFLLDRTGEPLKALESYGRSLEIQRRLAEANPTILEYQNTLKNSLIEVGLLNDRLGRAEEAITNLRTGIAMGDRLVRDPTGRYSLACSQARLAGAAISPGSGLSAQEARVEADRAITMLRRAVAMGYRDVKNIRLNKNLDPIRSRADFQELLMDLAFPDRPFSP
jgi:eukaryotic-like serine/threonine-protein kinase